MACFAHAHDCNAPGCRTTADGHPRPPEECSFCGEAFWREKWPPPPDLRAAARALVEAVMTAHRGQHGYWSEDEYVETSTDHCQPECQAARTLAAALGEG
jgi:hypothetical protein